TGRVWTGTDQGIYIFDPTSETFSLFHPTIVNEILSIKGDTAGNIWFIDNLTLYCYTIATGRLIQITDETSWGITSLGVSPSGDVWMGTMDGQLFHYDSTQGLQGPYA